MAKKPRLNSIDRFRKDPGRLVLEQHSHCEVPAGCGGVVLRWRNPLATRLFSVQVYTPWEVPCRIDGRELTNTLVDLAVGDHVLTFQFKPARLEKFRLMFTAVPGPRTQAGPAEPPFEVLTADDGTWKYTLAEPAGDAWTRPGYDDRGWSPLEAVAPPNLEWNEYGAYARRRCEQAGARCLAVPEPPRKRVGLWVRKAFAVPVPNLPGAAT